MSTATTFVGIELTAHLQASHNTNIALPNNECIATSLNPFFHIEHEEKIFQQFVIKTNDEMTNTMALNTLQGMNIWTTDRIEE